MILDRTFTPFFHQLQNYKVRASAHPKCMELMLVLVRENRNHVRMKLPFAVDLHDSEYLLDRVVKFMIYAYGGHTLYTNLPLFLRERLKVKYAHDQARGFDSFLMERVYQRPFRIESIDELPEITDEANLKVGGHLKGERIGFDLGASDFKVSAVKDGQLLFDEEITWNPLAIHDPTTHFKIIRDGLIKARSYLSRVDAIGGSSAGIIVNNEFRVASLLRGLSEEDQKEVGKNLIKNLGAEFNAPILCLNDGDVTALAGSLFLKRNGVLGLAMGSSEATGYVNASGSITGRLNELAFAPLDLSPNAALDEWSKDIGLGVQYFSQQAVNKLAMEAKIEMPVDMELKERLKMIQERTERGDLTSQAIFQRIGEYLGDTIPLYREFYEFNNLLLLGRVTSGTGGELILEHAQKRLKANQALFSCDVEIVVPPERMRRTGQAFAAATLIEVI